MRSTSWSARLVSGPPPSVCCSERLRLSGLGYMRASLPCLPALGWPRKAGCEGGRVVAVEASTLCAALGSGGCAGRWEGTEGPKDSLPGGCTHGPGVSLPQLHGPAGCRGGWSMGVWAGWAVGAGTIPAAAACVHGAQSSGWSEVARDLAACACQLAQLRSSTAAGSHGVRGHMWTMPGEPLRGDQAPSGAAHQLLVQVSDRGGIDDTPRLYVTLVSSCY